MLDLGFYHRHAPTCERLYSHKKLIGIEFLSPVWAVADSMFITVVFTCSSKTDQWRARKNCSKRNV